MYCSCSSMVSSSDPPLVGVRSSRPKTRRRASVWTMSVPSRPRTTLSYAASRPPSPTLSSADVAEHVRRQLLVRVEAAALLHEADALEIERGDLARLERRDAPPDVGEGALAAQPLEQARRGPSAWQSSSAPHSAAAVRGRVLDLVRHGVDRVGVDAVGEQAAAAIGDLAALGGRRRPCASAAARRAPTSSSWLMTWR